MVNTQLIAWSSRILSLMNVASVGGTVDLHSVLHVSFWSMWIYGSNHINVEIVRARDGSRDWTHVIW